MVKEITGINIFLVCSMNILVFHKRVNETVTNETILPDMNHVNHMLMLTIPNKTG